MVREGQIQQATEQLLTFERSESFYKEALAIASRYNRLKQEERLGTVISDADIRLEKEKNK